MSTPALAPWLLPVWGQFRNALGEQRLGHALLIAGEAGLGKRALVAAMVARLLCQRPDEHDHACGQCPACAWLAAGSHPDFTPVSPEEDSQFIKVAQIRAMNQRVLLTGQAGPLRVAVLDPAEAMNTEAQNALLKTLEEPPAGVHLILLSDAPSRLLATVRSRCRRFLVTAPTQAQAREWLQAQGQEQPTPLDLALAGGHPGRARDYADRERRAQAMAVAADLQALTKGADSAIAVAGRWLDRPVQRIDDAIAWLRLWTWQAARVGLIADAPPAPLPAEPLSDRYREALGLRERLRTPLKDAWLLHEWLLGWQHR